MNIQSHDFSKEEIENFHRYRDSQEDGRLRIRFIALLLLARGDSPQDVSAIIGKSPITIERWFECYVSKGIDSLNSFGYKPKKTFLSDAQIEQLTKWVKETYPPKLKVVRAYVQESFNVTYTIAGVQKLLKKKGLKCLRTKVKPNPHSVEAQTNFINKYTELRLFPGLEVLFLDGMHLVHQVRSSYYWGDPKNPRVFPANSSRQRLNILGAYNPRTMQLIHYTDESNCDAIKVIEFFEQILRQFPNAHSVVLILDNAPYFKARVVRSWLDDHPKLICWYLPTYSPNLNLIERFWRLAKDELVNSIYYKHYKTFRCNVFRFLNNIDKYKDSLKSLMNEKFQILGKIHA